MGDEEKTVQQDPEDQKEESPDGELILENPEKKKETDITTAQQLAMMRKLHLSYSKLQKKKAFVDAQKIIEARKKVKRREKNRNAKRARKMRVRSGG